MLHGTVLLLFSTLSKFSSDRLFGDLMMHDSHPVSLTEFASFNCTHRIRVK